MKTKSIKYLQDYLNGMKIPDIAKKYNVAISTIYKSIKSSEVIYCPFSNSCFTCPLNDCAIKDEYAYMINNLDYERSTLHG